MKAFETYEQLLAVLKLGQRVVGATISPELAADLVANHAVNRKVRPDDVKKYARAMREGRWNTAFPGIMCFDSKYKLKEAQHRCLASAASGVPLVVDVVPNVDDISGMDAGIHRTLSDQLGIEGFKNPADLAHVAQMYFRKLGGPAAQHAQTSHTREFLEGHKDFLVECVEVAVKLLAVAPKSRRIMSTRQLAYVRAELVGVESVSAAEVDAFLADAIDGGYVENSPAWSLYHLTVEKVSESLTEAKVIQMAIQAALQTFNKVPRRRLDLVPKKSKRSKPKKKPATAVAA
jgi:hypothetical protein